MEVSSEGAKARIFEILKTCVTCLMRMGFKHWQIQNLPIRQSSPIEDNGGEPVLHYVLEYAPEPLFNTWQDVVKQQATSDQPGQTGQVSKCV